MTILEMIEQWRKGCSNTQNYTHGRTVCEHPENCPDCTRALVDAIEAKLNREAK